MCPPRRSTGSGPLVPEYELNDRSLWNRYFEGGYLFREKINFELHPDLEGEPELRYGLDRSSPNAVDSVAERVPRQDGLYEFRVPVAQETRPGLVGTLHILATPWS